MMVHIDKSTISMFKAISDAVVKGVKMTVKEISAQSGVDVGAIRTLIRNNPEFREMYRAVQVNKGNRNLYLTHVDSIKEELSEALAFGTTSGKFSVPELDISDYALSVTKSIKDLKCSKEIESVLLKGYRENPILMDEIINSTSSVGNRMRLRTGDIKALQQAYLKNENLTLELMKAKTETGELAYNGIQVSRIVDIVDEMPALAKIARENIDSVERFYNFKDFNGNVRFGEQDILKLFETEKQGSKLFEPLLNARTYNDTKSVYRYSADEISNIIKQSKGKEKFVDSLVKYEYNNYKIGNKTYFEYEDIKKILDFCGKDKNKISRCKGLLKNKVDTKDILLLLKYNNKNIEELLSKLRQPIFYESIGVGYTYTTLSDKVIEKLLAMCNKDPDKIKKCYSIFETYKYKDLSPEKFIELFNS